MADVGVAAARRHAIVPLDGGAGAVVAGEAELVAGKGVAKDVAEVVPDVGLDEAVGKVGLGLAGVEAVAVARDLEGAAARLGVDGKGLGVALALAERVPVGDVLADGPERHLKVALVVDLGEALGRGGRGEARGDGEDAELLEHFESVCGWMVVRCEECESVCKW